MQMQVQLSPLWEHILRTRRMPETICPTLMFAEFHERLQDPEWQVRQHALRVLVDVLVVMQAKADKHMRELIVQLVENLGHQAPTVRKGALDCLRVYLAETAHPEVVMMQIFDIGLIQSNNEATARLSCGVLLSFPALLQSVFHTPQRDFIVQHSLERLVQHLEKLNHQEITLRTLTKTRELLGVKEFESYMTKNGGLTKYLRLCKVHRIGSEYEKPSRAGAWRPNRDHNWRIGSSGISHESSTAGAPKQPSCPEKGKVIMETEIKINEDTVTMRLLEADTETEESETPSVTRNSNDLVIGRPLSHHHDGGIVRVISDSELDEPVPVSVVGAVNSEPNTPSRGPKRVTFGGEVVKMRTPDSDAANSSANNTNNIVVVSSPEEPKDSPLPISESKTSELIVEIPIDNTKPLPRPMSSSTPGRQRSFDGIEPPEKDPQLTPSPLPQAVLYRSHSTSPVGSNNISPKVPHKQIEVLHNLQRDPSPRSMRRGESPDDIAPSFIPTHFSASSASSPKAVRNITVISPEPASPKSWEDLDIVNYKTIMDLRSGDWRNRLQGMAQLEIALSSSINLAQVQPYLTSLLRTLLSSERHIEVAELKRELLVNLITRLPLDNLENRTLQILTGLCRQSYSGANRVCRALMQRLPAGTIVAKLTAPEFLHAKSSKFRDHALQMSIYALMTLPGTCFDINILTAQTIYAAVNRKRRVRQAALEVLAVLADISSKEEVIRIVNEMGANSPALLAAVRTRLSRLQLPMIAPDGSVLYALNQPEVIRTGADVDWIAQGEGGSASPNAIKRRRVRAAVAGRNCGSTNLKESDENLQRHSFHSPPETFDITSPNSNDFSHRISQGARSMSVFPSNMMDRRLATKACSETSMDGRSTDSTTTTCSSGSGSFVQLTMRQVDRNSRFPAMSQHTDFVNNFMRSMQQTKNYPYPYASHTFDGPPAYPKVNYTLTKSPQHTAKKMQQQNSLAQQDTRSVAASFKANESKLQRSNSVFRDIHRVPTHALEKDNSEILTTKARSNVSPIDVPVSQSTVDMVHGSPISVKSTSYSQKSTASVKSKCESEPFDELIVDDMEKEVDERDDLEEVEKKKEVEDKDSSLKRNESVNSLHTTESIKTQLEDTTPQLSRAQSIKSLAIEEELEGSNSFLVVEEQVQHDLESSPPTTEPDNVEVPINVSARTHEDLVINSRSISLDSLYCSGVKQGSTSSSSTTDNNTIQTKPLLKQKSKTSYFLSRNQRRVSPVKQAIKMSQAELFPQNMTRFEKPREALLKTFDQLDSSNWEVNVSGLKSMVRLIRYHPEYLDSHMHMTCIQLTRSVRNLRSQVARAACQASAELFVLKSKFLETEFDDLICGLLHRTADTNRFLRADATRALESMVDHSQPAKILNILSNKGAQHQNALVRTTTAKLLFRLVERLGSDRIYAMTRENRDKFFVIGANLLLEGSLATRSYAKSLFRALSDHASYQRLLLEVIPPRTYRNVEKTLRSINR
ncbi:uncharacterized protein LOC6644333 [Drosophila willistoni]|nr:uncharacterized protein LOC6644333 [Drosophila willistoni]